MDRDKMTNLNSHLLELSNSQESQSYRFSVDKEAPLALVGDEELPAGLQLDDTLTTRDLPGGTLQLQVDVDALIFRSATEGDLKNGTKTSA